MSWPINMLQDKCAADFLMSSNMYDYVEIRNYLFSLGWRQSLYNDINAPFSGLWRWTNKEGR